MKKPLMIYQPNVFWETRINDLKTIRKYFDVVLTTDLPSSWIREEKYHNAIIRTGQVFNHLNKIPPSRCYDCDYYYSRLYDFILNRNYFLVHFGRIKEFFLDEDEIFIKPNKGSKIFTGGLMTEAQYDNLSNYLKDDNVLCCVAEPKDILTEFRCIFIDGKFVSGSQYLHNGNIYIKRKSLPKGVRNYAVRVSQAMKDDDFDETFVMDVALDVRGNLYLLELNAFYSSSFYGADLDLVYATLQQPPATFFGEDGEWADGWEERSSIK